MYTKTIDGTQIRFVNSILIKDNGTYMGWEPFVDEYHPCANGFEVISFDCPTALPHDIDTSIDPETGRSLYHWDGEALVQ